MTKPITGEIIEMPATGRPSRYATHADEIDMLVLDAGRRGYSLAQIAACLGVSVNTVRIWADAHPRFGEVLDIATTASQAWWEGRAMDGTANTLIGGTIWAKSMSARFPREYTERKDLVSTDGSMSPHKQLTEEELLREMEQRGLPVPDLD